MGFDINDWLNEISFKIKKQFKDRVLFIGYHGSYIRGEATDASDIDMVVILDKIDLYDLKEYKKIVKSMFHNEKACGFISGKDEIQNWSKSDMFQFCFETKALYGNLHEIITPISTNDIKLMIKSGAQAIYHCTCHSYLFSNDIRKSLSDILKNVFFILQAHYFLQNNKYISTKKELLLLMNNQEKILLENCINRDDLKNWDSSKIDGLYNTIIHWCSKIITSNN